MVASQMSTSTGAGKTFLLIVVAATRCTCRQYRAAPSIRIFRRTHLSRFPKFLSESKILQMLDALASGRMLNKCETALLGLDSFMVQMNRDAKFLAVIFVPWLLLFSYIVRKGETAIKNSY